MSDKISLPYEVIFGALHCANKCIVLIHNGEVVFMNQKVKEIGMDRLAENWTQAVETVLTVDSNMKFQSYLQSLKNGSNPTEDGIFEIIQPDGQLRLFKGKASTLENARDYLMLEFEDITDELTENRISKTLMFQFESLLNSAPIGVMIVEDDGKIVFLNNHYLRIIKMKREDIIGKNLVQFRNPAKFDKILNRLINAHEDKIEFQEVIHYLDSDGLERYFRVQASFTKSQQPLKSTMLIMFEEVTESVIAENKLKSFNNDLQIMVDERTQELKTKAQKLLDNTKAMVYMLEDMHQFQHELEKANAQLKILNEDTRAFNYMVSHDLKAPLRAVYNYSLFLKEEISDKLSDNQRDMLDLIISQAEVMSNLIHDLMRLSKAGNDDLNFTEIDMNQLFKSVVMELIGNKQVDILISPLPPIYADYPLMKQVVINLVSNAVRFALQSEKPCIKVYSTKGANETSFIVGDNGSGFDSSQSERIFLPFVKLKNDKQNEGTGIGLAIVKRIIEKHGGQVFATSDPENGTKIGFTLKNTDYEGVDVGRQSE